MIKVLFICHGSASERGGCLDFVGQITANRGNRNNIYYGFTTIHQSNHKMMYK